VAARRVRVNLAGQNFGFSLPNLEAEDGAEETQSVLSQYFPELKLAFGTKTQRGGRLGRSSVSVTPELALRQREAAVAGSASPISTSVQQTTAVPTSVPTPTREKRTPSTEFGQSSVYFGGEDYWRNIERGVTPQEIKEWAQSNPQLFRDQNAPDQESGLYNQIMRGNVRVESALTAPQITSTPTTTPAPSYAISSQLNIPREQAGFVSAPTPSPSASSRAPISAAYGISSDFFGGEDVKAAEAAGYSAQEIYDYISRNQNLLQGPNVKGAEGGVYETVRKAAGVNTEVVKPQLSNSPTLTPTPAPAPAPAPTPAPAPAPTPSYTISSQLNIPREQAGFVSAPTPSPSASSRAPISAAYGISSDFFGGEDVKAAEAAGYSAQEIYDYISRNQNLLQGPNVKGAEGGVYETVRRAAGR
jgi:hypothetical protein